MIITNIFPDYVYSIFNSIELNIETHHLMCKDMNIFNRNILLYMIIYGDNKFKTLFFLIENKFLTSIQTDDILDIFYKIQKVYRPLCRFAYLCKLKKTKTYDCDCDLVGEQLSNLPDKLKIDIIEDSTRYIFRLSDILNISTQALTHAPDMFAEPLTIKNPYTNISFKKYNLYNIYIKTVNSSYCMHQLFSSYCRHGFKLKPFLQENESIIRNISIKQFICNSPKIDVAYEIHQMIIQLYAKHLPNLNINIRNGNIHAINGSTVINDNILIKEFSHPLQYYLRMKYSLSEYDRKTSKQNLILELQKYNLTKIKSLHLQIEQDAFYKPTESVIVPLPYQIEDIFVFGQPITYQPQLHPFIGQHDAYLEQLLTTITSINTDTDIINTSRSDISGNDIFNNNIILHTADVMESIGPTPPEIENELIIALAQTQIYSENLLILTDEIRREVIDAEVDDTANDLAVLSAEDDSENDSYDDEAELNEEDEIIIYESDTTDDEEEDYDY